ncbi:sodium-independent sulfate anion transporter-like isoform X2 [Adelges cooleyi]|uniref:sodium-independent sulfate anion transporter-like isoform X2 n=1 Tax=Adelges cooleyi TaxID=133065 RepID=UPI0021804EE4|nr:sodium-independent sulfate anion transporter-like isoform X2 [Adelges cooleyi]
MPMNIFNGKRHSGSYDNGSSDFNLGQLEADDKNSTYGRNSTKTCFVKTTKELFTYKFLIKRLPILQWLPVYTVEDGLGDLMSGLTVGLTIIPQSLGYATIAGLPPQYGLYGSFLGSILYVFLGTCKEISDGPSVIQSLVTHKALNGLGPLYGHFLCFMTGLIQLAIGSLGLGFFVDFISSPVTSGFTSAVSLLILASQIKHLLGINAVGVTMLEVVVSVSRDIRHFRIGDTSLGIACIIILLSLRSLVECRVGPKNPKEQTNFQKYANRAIWIVGCFRNAIVIIVSTYISYALVNSTGHSVTSDLPPPIPFKVIGKLPSGLPGFHLPPFSYTQSDESTTDFFGMLSNIGFSVIVVPLIANGKTVDSNQEIIAIGLCNIGNSFVLAFPGTGSFSRAPITSTSGVRTPMEGLYSGTLVILALMFCTEFFYYIPRACLAAVIATSVVFMIEVNVVKPIYRSNKNDLIPCLVTFIGCLLLRIEIGVMIGICVDMAAILYHAARPQVTVQVKTSGNGVQYLTITPDRYLVFPSVDYVKNLIIKHNKKKNLPVVIDCSHIYGADFTTAKVIKVLTDGFSKRGQALLFYNMKPSVVAIFEGVKPKDFISYYHNNDLEYLLNKQTSLNTICA